MGGTDRRNQQGRQIGWREQKRGGKLHLYDDPSSPIPLCGRHITNVYLATAPDSVKARCTDCQNALKQQLGE